MGFCDFCKDKAMIGILNGTGIMLLSLFLLSMGNASGTVILIVVAWVAIFLLYMLMEYLKRKKYFEELNQLLEELDQRYLIAEVMKSSPRMEDILYREILRKSNKSVIEKIHSLEQAQREYKEYIESWIHEVKTPMTAIHLICENNKDEHTKRILGELSTLENQVEMALYYARMEQIYKDYLIHPVDLRQVVLAAIGREKQHFIECGMQIALEIESVTVSTDEKWVEFLLCQIFSNSMKYRKEEDAKLQISTIQGEKQVTLVIEDNGIGIATEDMRRIFDKGFTGKNGRKERASTGMGLYLCKGLCDKLGIGLFCESKEGTYTKMCLVFPDSDHNKILQN